MKKTVVIGDVHGCYDELMLLLDKLKYSPTDYDLILAGDLVDRGPKSKEVVAWALANRNNGVQCVAGNHDEKHFRYFKHLLKKKAHPNYNIPMRPFRLAQLQIFNSLSDEELTFLGELPGYIHLEDRNWIVVHAGLEPSKPLEDQTYGKMTHIRFVNPETMKTASLDDNYEPPSGSVFWTELYELPYNVVYGHHVHDKSSPGITTTKAGAQLVGIDTGVCFGGCLTGFIVPELGEKVSPEHFVQVQSIETYSDKLLNFE